MCVGIGLAYVCVYFFIIILSNKYRDVFLCLLHSQFRIEPIHKKVKIRDKKSYLSLAIWRPAVDGEFDLAYKNT